MTQTNEPQPEPSRQADAPEEGNAACENPPCVEAGHRRLRIVRNTPTALLLGLACVVIVIYGMRYSAAVLNPIFLALFVVMGLSPMLDWLRRRGVPAWLTITIVLAGFLAMAAGFVLVLITYAGQLESKLPVYQEQLGRILEDVRAWLAGHGVDAGPLVADAFTAERIIGWVSTLLAALVDAFSSVMLVILIVLFMLAQVCAFQRGTYTRLELSERFEHSFIEFGSVVRSYLFTKGWLAAIAAVISTGVYYAFGVDFALLWGLVFFVLSFIPNFGFIISVIPPFAMTLLEHGLIRAVLVVAVVIVINTIVDNMLAPRFMGKSVGLSTLAVFLSLVVWAWILGPIGALISIPLTLMVKLLFFDSYESTRSLSLFLTGGTKTLRDRGKKRKASPGECGTGCG